MIGSQKNQLTPKQKQVIEYMAEHLDANGQEIANACGVHFNSVYKWLKQDLFKQELDRLLHQRFEAMARPALETMLNLVKNGDRQASQYVLDNVGYKVAEKVDITANDIKIKIE